MNRLNRQCFADPADNSRGQEVAWTAVQLVDVVPYLLEDVLKAQGARFSATADWGVHVVRDGLLITGQNPASSQETARTLLAALAT